MPSGIRITQVPTAQPVGLEARTYQGGCRYRLKPVRLPDGLPLLRGWVILAGFSPNSHESQPPMEIQPILNTIKDLTERSQSIRGYL